MAEQDGAVLQRRLQMLNGSEAERKAKECRAAIQALNRDAAFRSVLAASKVLADGTRLLAAALLKRKGELCACEIQAALGVTHATVSHHMDLLLAAGFVEAEKRGRWMHYRLAPPARLRIP